MTFKTTSEGVSNKPLIQQPVGNLAICAACPSGSLAERKIN